MAREAIPGLGGITNRFGPRALPEGKAGAYNLGGSALVQYVVEFDGDDITAAGNDVLVIPAGFKPTKVYFETVTAGAITNSESMDIGTDGSEATNGFDVTEARLEAVGVYEITSFNGTWAAKLAANTTVGIAITGGSLVGGTYKATIEGYLA